MLTSTLKRLNLHYLMQIFLNIFCHSGGLVIYRFSNSWPIKISLRTSLVMHLHICMIRPPSNNLNVISVTIMWDYRLWTACFCISTNVCHTHLILTTSSQAASYQTWILFGVTTIELLVTLFSIHTLHIYPWIHSLFLQLLKSGEKYM